VSDVRRRRVGSLVRALGTHRDALMLALAALALAATFLDPGWPMTRNELEFVAVFDITQSMNVPDQEQDGRSVTRLARAKAAMDSALGVLPCGSKAGWAIFTEYRSFLLLAPVEVCAHQRELLGELHRLDGRMAWAGNSEVAKGLNSGMLIVHTLPSHPALVFLTDGHEAPPVSPRYRPNFALKRGEVRGLIVGVGADTPRPIPKTDPSGQPLGEWAADEVLQVDPRSLGRGGSVAGEQMVEPDDLTVKPLPGAAPGSEHLSSLREAYLQLLASEQGLLYRRLGSDRSLVTALEDERLAQPRPSRLDLRPALAALALAALLAPAATTWRAARRRRELQPRAAAASRAMRPQR
jgi:mxaL protein